MSHKILVVSKRTAYEEVRMRLQKRQGDSALLTCLISELTIPHNKHLATLKKVESVLKAKKIDYTVRHGRPGKITGEYSLVISVGGDGTFLRTAQALKDEPLLGVNSAPQYSVGALCSATAGTFAKKMDRFFNGRTKVTSLNRLQIIINGTPCELMAVNEVLFTNQHPAGTSRYRLMVNGKSEDHKSSGVWIATAAGSSAAIRAAGGQVVSRTSLDMQYLVREPFLGGKKKSKLTHGFVKPGKKIRIVANTLTPALYVDGVQGQIPIAYGDIIEIKNSPNALRVVI